jgi:hypothetical protein
MGERQMLAVQTTKTDGFLCCIKALGAVLGAVYGPAKSAVAALKNQSLSDAM